MMDTPLSRKINGAFIFLFIIFFLFFSGCNQPTPSQLPYIPRQSDSTPIIQPSSTFSNQFPSYTSQPLPTTQSENCTDNLLYIDDITIPDWTSIKPGTEVDKQWKVENNGTCDWDYQYTLSLTTGESMGAEIQQNLFPARAGSQVIIQITFITPLQAGTYHNVWQAINPAGQPFGDPISILVVVEP